VEKKLFAVCVFACLLSACATTNDQAASDQPREEGTYVTGSRLPQRTSGASAVNRVGKEEWEDSTRGHKQINPQGR
jgi:hypothetical protein